MGARNFIYDIVSFIKGCGSIIRSGVSHLIVHSLCLMWAHYHSAPAKAQQGWAPPTLADKSLSLSLSKLDRDRDRDRDWDSEGYTQSNLSAHEYAGFALRPS